MSTTGGALDPQNFVGLARRVALEAAQRNSIFLSPNALPAVDTLVKERMPRIERRFLEGTLDFAGWERLVRMAAEQVAKQYRAREIRSIDDPEELLRRVRPVLNVYPFDC